MLGTACTFGGSVRFYLNPIVLEFVFGMLLGWLFVTKRLFIMGGEVGFIVTAVGAALLWAGAAYSGAPRVLAYGIPAAMVLAGVLVIEARLRVPKISTAALIGDSSYSLYLAHLFPISVLRFGWQRLALPTEGVIATATFIAICAVLAIGVGILSYLTVERPSIRYFRNGAMLARKSNVKSLGWPARNP
jgi:exopolysaccharide production protein ExoZ